MQSLFPAQAAPSNQSLYQFKAGKCNLNKQANGKYQVTADKRRGQVSLVRSDGLLHFRWSNLANGTVEDDRIVMPGDGIFKKVKTGRETGDRVYMLKLQGTEAPFMYWMQDVDGSKDNDIVQEVNKALNGGASQSAASAAGNASAPWAHLLGNPQAAAPAVAATPVRAPVSSSGAAANSIGGLDFAALLNAFGVNQPAGSAPPASTPAPTSQATAPTPTPQRSGSLTMEDIRLAMEGRAGGVSLGDVLNAEEVLRSGVLSDPQVQQELLATLPAEHQTTEALEATLRSAQLQQAAQSFTGALQQTDNFHSIVSNFNLDPTPGISQLNQGDGVGAFLAALQAANPPQSAATTTNNAAESEEKQDGPEIDNPNRMEE